MAKGVVLETKPARELAWTEVGATSEGWTVVSNTEEGHSRWESIHNLVIKNEAGECFAADYRQGLTENQGTIPWEYEETVTFKQVFPKVKTIEVTDYVSA